MLTATTTTGFFHFKLSQEAHSSQIGALFLGIRLVGFD
jgi:hypothetical protein